MAVRKLSGLQKDVLALYRKILRETAAKDRVSASTELAASTVGSPTAESQNLSFNHLLVSSGKTSTAHARDKFRKEAKQVRRSDFKTIEYQIRKGEKQLKLLQMPGVNLMRGN